MGVLEINGLEKNFGGLRAVDNLSLSVSEGQILGVIGPNGAGKTTLFNLITGVYPPDKGTVTLSERNLTGLAPYKVCRAGVTRTFQVPKPFNDLSVMENVMVGCYLKDKLKSKVKKRAEEILDFVGLYGKKSVKASHLTLAERKMLEIGRALGSNPVLLLLDEVMSGFNPKEIDMAIELVQEIRRTGVTVLVIEHIFRVILGLADGVVVLDQGRKIAEDIPEKVVENEEVIKAYFGDDYVSA